MRLVRGDSMVLSLVWADATGAPIDISGASVRAHVRDVRGALALSASTEDGRIALDGPSGRIDVHVPYSVTEALVPGVYRYAVEVTLPNGVRRTLHQDDLLVSEDMTQ